MTQRKHRGVAGAAVSALALAVAAPATAQGQDDTVTIGVLTDLEGVFAPLSGEGSITATRMAVDDAGGQVAGRDIEIIASHHHHNAEITRDIIARWANEEGVDVVLDAPGSNIALAAQAAAAEHDVALITNSATTQLTGESCTATSIQYVFDSYSLAAGTAQALVEEGYESWYFVTADYSFGHQMRMDAAEQVKAVGGTVLGSTPHELGATDFSVPLLDAQASGADVVGLANAGGDTTNAIEQASSFGIVAGGQELAGLLTFLTTVDSLGLEAAQGLTLTASWYWDLNDETRAFADRFAARMDGQRPSQVQAGTYSAAKQYLNAVAAIDSTASKAVVDQLKTMEIDDVFHNGATVRADGRTLTNMHLMRVKSPAESEEPWDFYDRVTTIDAADAAPELGRGCHLVE